MNSWNYLFGRRVPTPKSTAVIYTLGRFFADTPVPTSLNKVPWKPKATENFKQ